MKCLIINVASAVERMAFMTQQMDTLGLSYQRLEAVTPDTVSKTHEAKYWETWERPLKSTEKACYLSHVAAWRLVTECQEPMLILEDDAALSYATPSILGTCHTLEGVDHLTLEVRKRKKIVSKKSHPLTETHQMLRLYQDRSGAAAYVIWPSGAQKLLHRAETQAALADAMICKAYELTSFQVEPACAVQLDKAAAYGIPTFVTTQSQIDAGIPAQERKTVRFKLRRLLSQLRMGIRAIRHRGSSERREIQLNPETFLS